MEKTIRILPLIIIICLAITQQSKSQSVIRGVIKDTGDKPLQFVGLEVLFAIAVLTLPAYMSGVAAYQKLRAEPGLSENAMRIHQDAALSGFKKKIKS